MKAVPLDSIIARAPSGAGAPLWLESAGPLRPTAVRILEVREPEQLWHVATKSDAQLWWKRYVVPSWKWPLTLLQRSRSRREACGLELLRQRDFPAPRVFACVEWHHRGLLHESTLITHAVPGTMPLTSFLRSETDPARRADACRAAGTLTANLHRGGVGHFRMLAKNVLIAPSDPKHAWILDAPYLCAWDRPTPRAVRAFDLASLCSQAGELDREQSALAVAAYAEASGEPWPLESLLGVARWRLRTRRIILYLVAIWTGHRPDRFVSLSPDQP